MLLDISKHAKFYRAYLQLFMMRAASESIMLENNEADITGVKHAQNLNNSLRAMQYLFEEFDGSKIYPHHIQKIASIVNEGTDSPDAPSKRYRSINVMINRDYFTPPSPRVVPELMMSLLENYHKLWDGRDPYEKEALFHIKLVRIQPFEDGNKRTARILMNYNLFKQDKAPVVIPWGEYPKYYDFIASENYSGFAKYLEKLSVEELEFMKTLYKNLIGEEYNSGGSYTLK